VLANLTAYGKRAIAQRMFVKGQSSVAAAILLRQQGGYEWVVLHLHCQGLEIVLKAFLLLHDYDYYSPRLRKDYGHDLEKLARATLRLYGLNPLSTAVASELHGLNQLYRQHLLRYASGYDLVADPVAIPSDRVLRRLVAALRLADAHGVLESRS
jgi:hypothetical protein